MMQSIFTAVRLGLLCALALALLSVPFAHRAGAAPISSDMAAFLEMGGTPADLCGDMQAPQTAGCEACRIVDAMLLADPARRIIAIFAPMGDHPRMLRDLVAAWPATRGPPPARAPPAV